MHIIKKVTVKHVLTADSKRKLVEKFSRTQANVTKEYEQLKFELKKLASKKINKDPQYAIKLEKELADRAEKIKTIQFQLQQLEVLPLGFELKETEVEALVEVEIGTEWEEISNQTIVLKDGKIHEIR